MAESEREKGASRKGTYFYWSDWSGREPKALTYAAKGLWIDMLAVMATNTPQGVIAGDLESLAATLGYAGPMAGAWAREYGHLIDELESKGVFSRGQDIDDDLDPYAIVNRRMYRDRERVQDISETRRQAALARWDRKRAASDAGISVDEVRAELGIGACKIDAKPCKADANGMQTKNPDVVKNKEVRAEFGVQIDAKPCTTPAQPNPTQPNPNPEEHARGPLSIGQCLPLVAPLTGKEIYDRLVAVTGDRKKSRTRWWNDVVNAFKRSALLHVLDDHLHYFEGESGEGIRSPSRLMAKRVLASAREFDVTVPELPKETQS